MPDCGQNIAMDPLPNLYTVFLVTKLKMVWFSRKVLQAFKGEPFGRAWLGIFRPQGGALWSRFSWLEHSSKGSLLLCSLAINFQLRWVKDPLLFGHLGLNMLGKMSCFSYNDKFSFQDGTVVECRVCLVVINSWFKWVKDHLFLIGKPGLHMSEKGSLFSYDNNFSFQDGTVMECGDSIKWFYSILRLQQSTNLVRVHGGFLGGGGGPVAVGRHWDLWGRQYSCLDVLCDLGIADRIGAEHLKKGRVVLNYGEGGVLVQLHHVEMGAVHPVVVDEAGGLKVPEEVLQVGVMPSLEPPNVELGALHATFQSRGQQVIVGALRVVMGKPVDNQELSLESYLLAGFTYLATIGAFLSGVCLDTDMMKLGGIWRPRRLDTRPTSMSTSFSPFLRRGTAGPLNTRDLRVRDKMYPFSILVFSPDHGSTVQSQKLGARLLVMTVDSPREVFLAGLEFSQLLGQTGNLGFDLGHGFSGYATFTLKVSQILTFWTCLAEGQIGGLINILVSTVMYCVTGIFRMEIKFGDMRGEYMEYSLYNMICSVFH